MVNPPPGWEPSQDQSFRSRFNQMRQDPRIQQAVQDVSAAHPAGEPFRTPRVMTGAARAGYQLGRDNPDMFGGGGGQPAWGSQNGDGGEEANGASEFATKDDLAQHAQGINERLDAIQGGLQNAGGVQDRNNAFQGGGSQQAAAPRPDVLGAIAEHNANIYSRMADSHASLQASKDRSTARFQQRQSQGGMHPVQPTGNAMGATTSEASMSGLLGRQAGGGISSNGQSESTFANTRFGGQQ